MKCPFKDCDNRVMYKLEGRPFDRRTVGNRKYTARWIVYACEKHAEKMLLPFLQMPNTLGRKLVLTEIVYDDENGSIAHRELII